MLQAKPRHPEKGESEKTATDKRRQRVVKKRLKKQRAFERQKRSRISQAHGQKASKRVKREAVGSSSRFFAALQQQVKQQVADKRDVKVRAGTTSPRKTGTHFKL